MSAGHIDILLALWATSLAPHGDEPPFESHTHMYDTIDNSPLGDVPWQTFSCKYNGVRPARDAPSWMDSEFDVWFRDARTLVQNILANPDFKDEIHYGPFQEYDNNGNRRFQDFMSGDWAFKQAVSFELL